jgi:hypothetical protein
MVHNIKNNQKFAMVKPRRYSCIKKLGQCFRNTEFKLSRTFVCDGIMEIFNFSKLSAHDGPKRRKM